MDKLTDAFARVPRANFLPPGQHDRAGWDTALPIGYGQTNSQPYTVRLMLEWLDAQPGEKVLDVGSGSGWTTALLAYIVGSKGRVYAVERIPELLEFGRRNVAKMKLTNARFNLAGEEYGLKEHAPYDRILVSASARELPQGLLDQLKNGGKMVIPVHGTILEIAKTSSKEFETTEHPGFVFVPLVLWT